jgi:hypothetical protein
MAAKADRLFSRDLVFNLNHVPDRPWMENVRGKAITTTIHDPLAWHGFDTLGTGLARVWHGLNIKNPQ